MRTTVDIPDVLFRQAKAQAALRGLKLKDLVLKAIALELESPDRGQPGAGRKKRPTLHDRMKCFCGIVDSGIPDLSTNPKYMKGFGRDSLGHR
jgi:hypothetical protein